MDFYWKSGLGLKVKWKIFWGKKKIFEVKYIFLVGQGGVG